MNERFHKHFLSHGGEVDYSALPPISNILIEGLRSFINKIAIGLKPYLKTSFDIRPLHFGIVDNDDVNAFASSDDTCDYIGIYNGLFPYFQSYSFTLLSHPCVFPEVGDANLDSASDIAHALTSNLHLDDMPCSLCQHRLSFSMALTVAMLRFICAHEVGHIMQGHTWGALRADTAEFGAVSLSALESIQRRVIECNADEVAAKVVFSQLTKKSLSQDRPWNCRSAPTPVLFEMLAAQLLLFRIIDASREETLASISSSSMYPHSYTRTFMSLHVLAYLLGADAVVPYKTVLEMAAGIDEHLSQVWVTLELPGYQRDTLEWRLALIENMHATVAQYQEFETAIRAQSRMSDWATRIL